MAKDNLISKFSRRFFERKNLLPDKDGHISATKRVTEEMDNNMQLLMECANMYASLFDMRRERQRNINYYYGKQFDDLIPNPNGCGMITEYNYLVGEGYIPLSLNIILPKINALVGVYRQEAMEPLAISRVREEQKLGELLTTLLQYAYSSKNMPEDLIQGYKEYNVSALPIFRTDYRWDSRRKIKDVSLELKDLNDMFWSYNYNDPFFENISVIGCLYDMTMGEILKSFATTAAMAERIQAAYGNRGDSWENYYIDQQFKREDKDNYKSFYTSVNPGKYRVIEVWREEEHYVYPCWDKGKGEAYTLPCTPESKAYIDAENAKRIAQMVEAGGAPEDAALIEVGYEDEQGEWHDYRIDTDWVVRYMTPNGYVLKIEVAPYLHGSHPFVVGAFPLINGEVHSVVSDLRNTQRMINRLLTADEYERINKSHGGIGVNLDLLERSNVTVEQFAKEYTNPKGVLGLRWKEGEEITKPFAARPNADHTNNDNKLQFYLKTASDISGAMDSILGKHPTAGTPASLYAQETQNANNNIADRQEWYNSIVNRVNYKLMMLILQHYDRRRLIEIAGTDFTHEIDYIINTPDRQRQTLFDLQLIKSPQSGFTRAQREQMLQTLFEAGAIPAQVWLDNTSLNGADKISEQLKQIQQEQAEAQQQAAMNQQQAAALQQAHNRAAAMQGAAPAAPAPPMG